MKKLLTISAFAIMITCFYGCPLGLDYPLGTPGKEKIENELLGTWKCTTGEADVKKAEISKIDDYTYKVVVLESGEMYAMETNNYTGWITKVDGKTFFYVKPENEEKYYHYQYFDLDGKKMTSCDLSLLDGGIDAVTSTEALRTQVSSSMKKPEFYKETSSWVKE